MLKRQINAEFQNGNCCPPPNVLFFRKEDPLYQPFLLKSFQQERQEKEIALQREEKEQQEKEIALQREEKERQEKEIALQREKKALAEVERLRVLLQDKDSDPS